MKKLFLLIIPMLMGLMACSNKLTVEQAEASVVQGENDNLPLLVQKLSNVESIVIDSIYIRIVDEPMSGYLYTTWKYVVKKTIRPTVNEMMRGIYESREVEEEREKQVIVEVSDIQQSKEHKGYIEWQTGWSDAYRVILNDMY
jgi:hypothetical protein